ncbi:MAG: hypothetical protein U0694_14940 [Anaerolineae bacterium]
MPVAIQWLDEQHTILLHNYNGRWSAGDAYQIAEKTALMLNELAYPVDLIVDFSGSRSKAENALIMIKELESRISRHQRLIVAVNFDTYLKSMLLLAQKSAPRLTGNLHYARSRGEALRFINDYRSRKVG